MIFLLIILSMRKKLKAFLFDLDGTLADTAHDVAQALNQLLISQNKKPLPFSAIRPVVSDGSEGLLKLGFGLSPLDADYAALREKLLFSCRQDQTVLFKGIHLVLDLMKKNNHYLLGIVTNKIESLTQAVVKKLKLDDYMSCVVCGDTLPQKKPDPAPLLYAASLLNTAPEECGYIGDAKRDIVAARAAGMFSIAALYGYISREEDPLTWHADGVIRTPYDLRRFF